MKAAGIRYPEQHSFPASDIALSLVCYENKAMHSCTHFPIPEI